MNTAPERKPRATTNQAGSASVFSARSMAGCKSDQKLAAIITPEAKPSKKFIVLGLGLRKQNTVAAPKAVSAQVPSVAKSASTTTFSIISPHSTEYDRKDVFVPCVFIQKKEKNYQKGLDKKLLLVYNIRRLADANQKSSEFFRSMGGLTMNLLSAKEGEVYIIRAIETDDEDMNAFLFSLGCYSGEPITVISRRKGSCVVAIKDGRYSIDSQLAEAIII